MHGTRFLLVTAIGEGLMGLFLLLLPALPLTLLLGMETPNPETLVFARVGGAALVAIGAISGLARTDDGSAALRAVLFGILVYDVAVAAVLAYAGTALQLVGILLWPAVLAHAALAVWCVVGLHLAAQPMRAAGA